MRKASQRFERVVEHHLKRVIRDKGLDAKDKIKALNVAVRWAAVKNKITLPEHGQGFLEDEQEETDE